MSQKVRVLPLTLLALALLSGGVFIRGCAQANAQTLSNPESVELDPASKDLYISNTNSNQILKRSALGTLSVFKDLPAGTDKPYGIEIVRGVVFVAHRTRVRGYRLSDAVEVLDFPIAGASFLNGISSDGANRLFVSDFSLRDLHQIDISNLAAPVLSTLTTETTNTPNGLHFDAANNRLLVAGWGSNARIKAWNFSNSQLVELINTNQSSFDGIVLDCSGRIYVSSWGAAALLRFELPFSLSSVGQIFANPLSNVADIAYARSTGKIYAPSTSGNTITEHPTECLLGDGFDA